MEEIKQQGRMEHIQYWVVPRGQMSPNAVDLIFTADCMPCLLMITLRPPETGLSSDLVPHDLSLTRNLLVSALFDHAAAFPSVAHKRCS